MIADVRHGVKYKMSSSWNALSAIPELRLFAPSFWSGGAQSSSWHPA